MREWIIEVEEPLGDASFVWARHVSDNSLVRMTRSAALADTWECSDCGRSFTGEMHYLCSSCDEGVSGEPLPHALSLT